MVMKIQNHHRALTDYINANLNQPFEWGKLDCVTFAIGAIEAMIGREVDKPEFKYRSRIEAIAFSKTWSLEEGMIAQLQAYEVPYKFHQPGDILIVKQGGHERTYVVFDRRVYSPLPGSAVAVFNIYDLYDAGLGLKLLRFD